MGALALFGGMAAAQTGVIAGTVMDRHSGRPVERAQVTLTRQQAGGMEVSGGMVTGVPGRAMQGMPAPEAAVLTDAEGRYRFEKVGAGEYLLQARRTGFFSGPPVRVKVGEGATVMAEELSVSPPSIVSGVVVDEDGEPVEGVQVQMLARRASAEGVIYVGMGSTATDDRGRFRIATAQAGVVVLSARAFVPLVSTQAPGQVYVTTYYPSTLDAAEAREVVLKPGAPLEDLKVQLRSSRVYTVKGRVLDVDGKPVVAGLHVRPKSGDSGGLGAGVQQRGAEGFEVTMVPPGDYTLTAHQFDRNQQRTASVEVRVRDRDVAGVEIRMSRGVKVAGVVEAPMPPGAGEAMGIVPVEGMDHRQTMRLFLNPAGPMEGARSYTIEAKEDGTFTLEDVQPGRYEVSGFQYGTYLASVTVGGEERLGKPIEVKEGMGELRVEYRADGGTVSVRVTGETGSGRGGPVFVLLPVEAEKRRAPFLLVYRVGGRTMELRGVRPGEYVAWVLTEFQRYDALQDAGFMAELMKTAVKVKVEPDGMHEVTVPVSEWPGRP